MFIIQETGIRNVPKNIKKSKDKIQFECVLQTHGDINRNKRRYSKTVLEGGIGPIKARIKEGSFLGELDHPATQDPMRQLTVLYKEVSHKINEIGWDGNKLVGVLETLRTPNGTILKNLAEDKIPVGFSLRGTGDLKQITENGKTFNEVKGPFSIITWDSVSYPSHEDAKLIKINESVAQDVNAGRKFLHESVGIQEKDGMICTKEGYCYFPNDFDRLVEQRIITLTDKYFV